MRKKKQKTEEIEYVRLPDQETTSRELNLLIKDFLNKYNQIRVGEIIEQ